MSLTAALILDAIFGEPDWLWRRLPHPAVLLGRLVGALDRRLNRGGWRRAKGALALAALVAVALAIGWSIAILPLSHLPEIVAAAILLAQRSLADHVSAVADGLDMGVSEGRAAVAHIVGRDTAAMDEPAVARAAIESAAENFSDGVVAPALWFAIGGLPAMLAYKAVNTADSMIGYRTEKYAEFGWAAARLDDLANLPASRLSALLISVSAFSAAPFRAALRDARLHRSPNAGWPEAAAAGALDLALAGPRKYGERVTEDPWLNPAGRKLATARDVRQAVNLIGRAYILLIALLLGIVALTL